MLSSFHGFGFLLLALVAIYVAVHVMFELRESEKRKGVVLNC